METGAQIKSLLQTQLASDLSAVKYLPYCLDTLTQDDFLPSSHLTKWTTRINSLMHSKEPGARWAGLCLAYKTSLLSQSIMIQSAQSWLPTIISMLSRNETLPTLKAAVRLLRIVFTSAMDVTEFQRQVSTPNIPKVTAAITNLADARSEQELKILCIQTLTRFIQVYPAAHRASSPTLNAFALRYLGGSSPSPTPTAILHAAASLYAALHLTGGKVGGAGLWRKALDDTLAFSWAALLAVRSTFPVEGGNRPPVEEDPQYHIPLNLDRLRCGVVVLFKLLTTSVSRPVLVPLGNIFKFITAMLKCSTIEQITGFSDPLVRRMEVSITPKIWAFGCELLDYICEQFPFQFDSHAITMLSLLAHRLDQKPETASQVYLVRSINNILESSHTPASAILPTRLAKLLLPTLVKVVLTHPNNGAVASSDVIVSKGKKKSKKFESDEVLKASSQAIFSTEEDQDLLLLSIDAIQKLYEHPDLTPALKSVIARLLIAILMALPRTSPKALSTRPELHHVVHSKVQRFAATIASGNTSITSKSLPLITRVSHQNSIQKELGLIIHPRIPPLIRSMPQVESLSFFKSEESHEEAETLDSLKAISLHTPNDQQADVSMQDITTEAIPPAPAVNPSSTGATDEIQLSTTTQQSAFSAQRSTEVFPSFAPTPRNPPSQPMHELSNEPTQLVHVATSAKLTPFVSTGSSSNISQVPSTSTAMVEDDEEDEEMPTINMDSDTDEEEEQVFS
ncbi:rRNA processing/ribosome biogenesis-domain-containing protein [Panaeolus papilionaceus]|nr:rRNA processing/ribosome biogenesis-domain-containing protein [Panaeolus papilionaceus]